MNNSIRKCDPTFFIPWDTVDSMFSLWTKQYFGDQVIRMHLDYDLHDNSYSFLHQPQIQQYLQDKTTRIS